MHTTPISLLERLRAVPDSQAWNRFIELYTPLLAHFARRLGLDEADAADLVQEVLTLLLTKLPEFVYQKDKSFRRWLQTVSYHKWCELRRRNGKIRVENSALIEQMQGPEPDFFDENEYRQHLVAHALRLMQAEFQPTTWRACWETVVGEKEPQQVAEELGLSVGAVYSAKFRVLARLRAELKDLME